MSVDPACNFYRILFKVVEKRPDGMLTRRQEPITFTRNAGEPTG
jgi:hypothetical protein